MLVLILDSATPAVTAAVAEVGPAGATVLAERVTVDARAHGELLAPQVRDVLAGAGAHAEDLAAVVAGLGPGPFTGLRVGLVTAVSMAQALGIPAYGVCTLDALGHAAFAGPAGSDGTAPAGSDGTAPAGSDGTAPPAGAATPAGTAPPAAPGDRILVATDARRHEVYWAVYQAGHPLTAPAVDRPADLRLPDGVVAAVGDGALRYADVLRDAHGRPLPVRDEPRYPPAASLASLAAGRVLAGAPGEELTPLYLRRPDAVEPAARKRVLP